MDYVSEFESSTDDSTRSSFWESSTLDDSTETGSELSSIHSRSEPEETGSMQSRKASAEKIFLVLLSLLQRSIFALKAKACQAPAMKRQVTKMEIKGMEYSRVKDGEDREAEGDGDVGEVEEDGEVGEAEGQLEVREVKGHQGGEARLLLECLDQQSRLLFFRPTLCFPPKHDERK